MGVIQISKANLVDDPYNNIQLQSELRIDIYIYIFFFFNKKYFIKS